MVGARSRFFQNLVYTFETCLQWFELFFRSARLFADDMRYSPF
jgi:hypothetical protein